MCFMTDTFENASERLDKILAQLSEEETPLDEAITLYAEAAKLIAFCNDTLKNAKLRVEEIDAEIKSAGDSI